MTEILDFKTRKRQQVIEEEEKLPTAKDWLLQVTTEDIDKYNGGILILFNDDLELSDVRSLNVMSVDYLWYSEILRQIAMEE
jgi:hypothetical protein